MLALETGKKVHAFKYSSMDSLVKNLNGIGVHTPSFISRGVAGGGIRIGEWAVVTAPVSCQTVVVYTDKEFHRRFVIPDKGRIELEPVWWSIAVEGHRAGKGTMLDNACDSLAGLPLSPRDWLANKFLDALFEQIDLTKLDELETSRNAYKFADAVIAESRSTI